LNPVGEKWGRQNSENVALIIRKRDGKKKMRLRKAQFGVKILSEGRELAWGGGGKSAPEKGICLFQKIERAREGGLWREWGVLNAPSVTSEGVKHVTRGTLGSRGKDQISGALQDHGPLLEGGRYLKRKTRLTYMKARGE